MQLLSDVAAAAAQRKGALLFLREVGIYFNYYVVG